MNLGNQMQKGNNPGGWNLHNEDYYWEKYRNGYKGYEVTSVEPFCITSNQNFEGIRDYGFQIIDGIFITNTGDNFEMIMPDANGFPLKISANPGNQDMAATQVIYGPDEDGNGWSFKGWLITLIGAVNESPGLPVLFSEWRGGSYPTKNNFAEERELFPTSPVAFNGSASITPLNSTTGFYCTFRVPFIPGDISDISDPELWTTAEVARLLRGINCDIELISFSADTASFICSLHVTNIEADAEVEFLLDIAVHGQSFGPELSIINCQFYEDATDANPVYVVIEVPDGGTDNGYISGLMCCRNELHVGMVCNVAIAAGSDANGSIWVNGSQNVIGSVTNDGAAHIIELTDLDNNPNNLFTQPAFIFELALIA